MECNILLDNVECGYLRPTENGTAQKTAILFCLTGQKFSFELCENYTKMSVNLY